MSKRRGFYPCPAVDTAGSNVVSQVGGLLLTETVRAVGLDRALSTALRPWRRSSAVHDPGKVVGDLTVTPALGGDCLADIALLRCEPGLFGRVASDPTVSRTIDRLAQDSVAALTAINTARASARKQAWSLAGEKAPDHGVEAGSPLIIDVDATLITRSLRQEGPAPTFERGFGHHPLWAFVDHGPEGTGEPLAVLLRPGNAGSNTAADHIRVLRDALRQLPGRQPGTRPGRKVLIRTDSAGATSGSPLPDTAVDELAKLPEHAWQPAYDADGEPRPGAAVVEVTGLLDLSRWPNGMRVIVRRERPHSGGHPTERPDPLPARGGAPREPGHRRAAAAPVTQLQRRARHRNHSPPPSGRPEGAGAHPGRARPALVDRDSRDAGRGQRADPAGGVREHGRSAPR